LSLGKMVLGGLFYLGRMALATVVVTAALEYTGKHSKFVRENKDWLAYLPFLISPGKRVVKGTFAFMTGAIRFTPRMFAALSVTKMNPFIAKGLKGITTKAFSTSTGIAARVTNKAGQNLMITYNTATRAFRFDSKGFKYGTAAVAAAAIGSLTAFHNASDNDKRSMLEDYVKTCFAGLLSTIYEVMMTDLRSWLEGIDPVRLLGAPASLAEQACVMWPDIDREVVVSLISRILNEIDESDLPFMKLSVGRSEITGRESIHMNEQKYEVDEDKKLVFKGKKRALMDFINPHFNGMDTNIDEYADLMEVFMTYVVERGYFEMFKTKRDGVLYSRPLFGEDIAIRLVGYDADVFHKEKAKEESVFENSNFFDCLSGNLETSAINRIDSSTIITVDEEEGLTSIHASQIDPGKSYYYFFVGEEVKMEDDEDVVMTPTESEKPYEYERGNNLAIHVDIKASLARQSDTATANASVELQASASITGKQRETFVNIGANASALYEGVREKHGSTYDTVVNSIGGIIEGLIGSGEKQDTIKIGQ